MIRYKIELKRNNNKFWQYKAILCMTTEDIIKCKILGKYEDFVKNAWGKFLKSKRAIRCNNSIMYCGSPRDVKEIE